MESGTMVWLPKGATRLAAVAAFAAVLFAGGCEKRQEPRAVSPSDETGQLAQQQENGSSAQVTNVGWRIERTSAQGDRDAQTVVMIPGPDGGEGLRITRHQPAEVRAGETLRYTIEVENTSETVLRDIVVEEWRTGTFYLERAQVLDSQEEQQRQSGMQTSQSGESENGANVQQVGYQEPNEQPESRPDLQQEEQQPEGQQQSQQPGQQQQQSPQPGQQQQQGEQPGQQQQAQSDNRSRWTIEALQPGETRTIEVVGVAGEQGQIQACMGVTYEPTICAVTQVVQPEVLLARTVESDLAYVCDEVAIVYIVENVGSGTASNLQISENFPEGLRTADGANSVAFTVDQIEPGERLEQRVVLRADSPGDYASHATLTGSNVEARSRTGTIRFVKPQIELTVDGPQTEYVGRNVPLDITVRNASEAPALETNLAVQGLADLPRVSLSTRQAEIEGDTIRLGRLEPGEFRSLRLTFLAQQPQSHALAFAVDAYCAEPVTRQLAVDVQGVEAVRLETVDLVDPVTVGQETIYEVQVVNQGTAESLNVRINATLPQEMTFVGGEGDSEVTGQGQQVQLAAIPSLAPGDVATWRIVARAELPGRTQMQLELTSDATTQPAIEQEPTTILPQTGQDRQQPPSDRQEQPQQDGGNPQ